MINPGNTTGRKRRIAHIWSGKIDTLFRYRADTHPTVRTKVARRGSRRRTTRASNRAAPTAARMITGQLRYIAIHDTDDSLYVRVASTGRPSPCWIEANAAVRGPCSCDVNQSGREMTKTPMTRAA